MDIEVTESLRKYLIERLCSKSAKSGLSLIIDVTDYCNLACVGCCVNAIYTNNRKLDGTDKCLNFDLLKSVLQQVKALSALDSRNIYINFGGGEPFIRSDFVEILQMTRAQLPSAVIAVDTNGGVSSVSDLVEASRWVDLIAFSIDGTEDFHNSWRRPKESRDNFSSLKRKVCTLLEDRRLQSSVEVTCVATSQNIESIPDLIEQVMRWGVEKFSIHRAMAVGRGHHRTDFVPTSKQYFELAKIVAEKNETSGFSCHMHHTLDAIYGNLLLGLDTRPQGVADGKSNVASSFAIDPKGRLHIDPWLTAKPWSKICLGSLFDSPLTYLLSENNPAFLKVKNAFALDSRCGGCLNQCSGGSRIAAAADSLARDSRYSNNEDDLIAALATKDPACLKL